MITLRSIVGGAPSAARSAARAALNGIAPQLATELDFVETRWATYLRAVLAFKENAAAIAALRTTLGADDLPCGPEVLLEAAVIEAFLAPFPALISAAQGFNTLELKHVSLLRDVTSAWTAATNTETVRRSIARDDVMIAALDCEQQAAILHKFAAGIAKAGEKARSKLTQALAVAEARHVLQPEKVVKHLRAGNPFPDVQWNLLERRLTIQQQSAWTEYNRRMQVKALQQRDNEDADSAWSFWLRAMHNEDNLLHPLAAFSLGILSISTTSSPVEGQFSVMNYFENARRLSMSDDSMLSELVVSSNRHLIARHIQERLSAIDKKVTLMPPASWSKEGHVQALLTQPTSQ